MTLREKTFPTVRTSISRVDTTRIQFSTAATAFMIFLKTFMLSPPLGLLVRVLVFSLAAVREGFFVQQEILSEFPIAQKKSVPKLGTDI